MVQSKSIQIPRTWNEGIWLYKSKEKRIDKDELACSKRKVGAIGSHFCWLFYLDKELEFSIFHVSTYEIPVDGSFVEGPHYWAGNGPSIRPIGFSISLSLVVIWIRSQPVTVELIFAIIIALLTLTMALLHSSSHFSTLRWTPSSHPISLTSRRRYFNVRSLLSILVILLSFMGNSYVCLILYLLLFFKKFLSLGPVCHCRCRMRNIGKSLKQLSMWCRELVVYALT